MKYIVILVMLAWSIPAQACDLKTYSKKYINEIHSVVGGEKPSVRVKRYKKNVLGDYTYATKMITVYSDNYEGECVDVLPSLKSLISHEYGHHLNDQIENVTGIENREEIAHLAEHSFGSEILKDTEYDNELTKKGERVYKKLNRHLKGLYFQTIWKKN